MEGVELRWTVYCHGDIDSGLFETGCGYEEVMKKNREVCRIALTFFCRLYTRLFVLWLVLGV